MVKKKQASARSSPRTVDARGSKQIVKEFYEQVFSNNQLEKVSKYIAKKCVVRIGDKIIPVGVDGMAQHIRDVRKTYPDFTMSITHQYSDGDYVISEVVAKGTHKGEWLGMVPTGKVLIFTGVDVDKVENGKITEHGGAINTFETLFEAGIIVPARKK